MSHTFEFESLGGIIITRVKESFPGYDAAKAAAIAHKEATTGNTGYKVVRVGYVKKAPAPELIVRGSVYGWLCEDREIKVYGNSAVEAVELWTAAYKRERDM